MGRHKLKGYWDSMDSNFWRRMYEELADSSSDISDDNVKHAFVDVLCKIYTCRNTDNMLKTAVFCNSKHNCEGEKHLPTLRFLLDHIDYSQQDLDDAVVRVIENGCFKDVKPTVKLLLQKKDSADIHSIAGHETRT